MRRKWVVAAVACAALLIPAVLTAMVTKTGDGAAAPPTRLGPNEELSYIGPGSNESGEAERSAAREDYANRAYPSDTIAFAQTQGAITAGKKVKGKGSNLDAKWKELGPDTLNVGQFGTQNLMVPTEWTGRIAALAVDPRHCKDDHCRLFIGSAGGGVWMTNNALAKRPHWHERNDGLDSRAIGSLVFDPTDPKGKTMYVGTGEENGSSDNEAGLGVYKSTDEGHHWTVLPGSIAAAKDRGVGDIAIDPNDPNHIYIGTMVARHGVSSVNGGRFTPPGAPRLGLYESKDGGNTFTLIYSRDQDATVPGTPTGLDLFRGSISRIQFDPNDPSIFYFTMFNYGAFRAQIAPAGTTVTQIFTEPNPNPPGPSGLAGIRFELAAAALPNGKTRLYLGEGSDQNPGIAPTVDASKLWRVDDAAAATGNASWTLLSNKTDGTPGFSSFDFCRNQCSYDMPVASPPGRPDEVWLGGVTQYQELPSRTASYRSNGRAVMRSVDGGVQFTDATGDARHFFLDIHPDIHAFAFGPNGITFVASDGGISRTSGNYVDFSSDCDTRNLTGVSLKDCRDWLSAIPDQIIAMNSGLNVLEFQALAVDPNDPNDIIGGTQDNGTPTFDGHEWRMDVLGDGGPTGIDVDGTTHYHQYSGVTLQVNWDGIDPTPGHWIWIADPVRFSGEAASFYPALEVDPVVSQTAYTGARHVWRTKDAGGSNRDFMRIHCDALFGDRTATGPTSGCGDFVALGGAAGDLGAGADADKGGGQNGYVVRIRRSTLDTGTMWVGTRRGRVFITQNADAEPASAVTYTRIDTPAQPTRFVSGISIDPADKFHAIVSFSGYAAYTPGQNGHVFDVRFNPGTGTATWTDLTSNLGDQPVTDVVYDGATGDIYAATDFGVDRLPQGSTTWEVAGRDQSGAAVYGLTFLPRKNGERFLYAATHGRGAWRLDLPKPKK
jgi:hypothetical protein